MDLNLIVTMAGSAHGERVALGDRRSGMTFAALCDIVGGGARLIADAGAGHLVYIGRNGPAVPQLLFSATSAGVPFVPINYRLADEQIHRLLDRLAAPLVVVEDRYVDAVRDRDDVVIVDDFLPRAAASHGSVRADVDGSAPAVILFTSGTTSEPKMVPLRHENLASYLVETVEFGSADEDDAALVTVPPYHVAGIGSVLSNLYSGRRVVYLPDFDAARWLELVRAERITTAMVVPTMLARIVDHLDGALADASSLRSLSYGGARTPSGVIRAALAAFPDTGFVNAYGLTETSSTMALLGPDDHRAALTTEDPQTRARLSSVGRPVPGIELEVRDDDGRAAAAGSVGELWVRGRQVSGEYTYDTGATSVLDPAGWFPTRDRARIDTAGYLFIEGRSDDTIIRGGENIAPAEIEDVLLTHPAVRQAAVVGIPDEEWGERIVAIVVRRSGIVTTEAELRDHVRATVRGSRTPDAVVWRDELPHTPTGKLLRRELVADLVSEAAGSVAS